MYLRLLRNRRFAALCAGQAVSLLGDALFPILVVVYAARGDSTAQTIGVVFAARFIALGGVVLFSGGLLDRISPVRSAVMADSARVLGLLLLASAWRGEVDFLVIAVAILIGACEAVSEPALLVIAPRLLPAGSDEYDVTTAYGLLEALRSLAGVVGPSLAALIVAVFSPSAGAAAAAAAFAASAVATGWAGRQLAREAAAARDDAASERQTAGADDESLLVGALGGLAVLWRVRWLRNVELLAVAHVVFAVGPWMVALPVAVLTSTGSVAPYAVILGAFSAGTVVGALLANRVGGRSRGVIALALLALFGLTALAPAVTSAVPVLVLMFALGGAGQQAFDVVKMSALRSEVPERLHGRAFSADFFFSFASLPLGQVLGAAALFYVDARTILIWAGVFVLMTTAIPLFSPDTRRFAQDPLQRAGAPMKATT